MKRVLFKTFFITILASCTAGYSLKKVDRGIILHDENSKVWVIDQEIEGGVNLAPMLDYRKKLMIFYKGGQMRITPVQKLVVDSMEYMDYFVNDSEDLITIYTDSSVNKLKFKYFTRDSILMESTQDAKRQVIYKIKPLPKY